MVNHLDYDKFGHCIFCSKNMVIDIAVNGKIEKRFTPDYQETEVLLSDFSKMRVCTCDQCKAGFGNEDFDMVMGKVYRGWEREVNLLPWDEAKRKSYLYRYNTLKIVTFSEGKPNDILEKEYLAFKEK